MPSERSFLLRQGRGPRDGFTTGIGKGFTLVELLVVIGIIALLIGILLPVLGRARESARSLRCMSNLRSMGQASVLYAMENKGRIPRDLFGSGYFFASQIMRQLGQQPIPSDRVKDQPYLNDRFKQVQVYQCPSVFAPEYGLHYTSNSMDYDLYRRTLVYKAMGTLNATKFPRPTEVLYIVEANVPSSVLTPSTLGNWDVWKPELLTFNGNVMNATPRMIHGKDSRHRGRTNIGFLDGHVESRLLKPSDLPVRLFNPYAP